MGRDRLDTGWRERMRDRARALAFARFVWARFVDDRLLQAGAALAYTTAFALVPLAVVVLGVLAAFPSFQSLSGDLVDYVLSNFVPSSADAIKIRLTELSGNIGKLTAAGTVALVVSLLVTLNSVEATFNRIWRVASARPQLSRYLVYWTVLTLGALLAAASLSVSARFFALTVFANPVGHALVRFSVGLAPVLIELAVVMLVYRVVPHHSVKWRHAFAGAVVAVLLLELIKVGLGFYLASFQGYQNLYGAAAFIPILMLWIYLGWCAILLGASLASSLAAFRYQPAAMRLPPGYEVYALLRLVGRFSEARRDGRGLHTAQMLELEPLLTDSLLQELLTQLDRVRVVRRDERGEWLLARDLDKVTLGELYEACGVRIPVDEAWLPCHEDALGQDASAVLDDLRLPLRDALRRRVGSLYPRSNGE